MLIDSLPSEEASAELQVCMYVCVCVCGVFVCFCELVSGVCAGRVCDAVVCFCELASGVFVCVCVFRRVSFVVENKT